MRWIFIILLVLAGAHLVHAQQPEMEAHVGKGTQLMQQQLFEAAAKEFEQALTLNPSDPRAHFQFAVCLLSLGRNDEARQQFEQVRKLGGESRYLTYDLGRLDLLSNDYASAIRRLGSVVEDPPFPDTAFHLGVAYVSSGDVSAGIKYLERAAKVLPRTETEARACTTALHSQSLEAAREVCHRLFEPNDPEKLTLLGQLFGDAGAFDAALDPLNRAVKLDPKSFEAWHNLGVTYFRLQRYTDAREALEKAVALRPEFYGSVVLLGATLYILGDDDAALPVLEHAHRLNPADTQTMNVLEKLSAGRQKR